MEINKIFGNISSNSSLNISNIFSFFDFISNDIYDKILYVKKVPSLKLNDILNKACEERGILLFKNPKEKLDRNQLIEFLDNYSTNFFIVNEYINKEKKNAQNFLIEMLKNDYQILLNRRLKEFDFVKK